MVMAEKIEDKELGDRRLEADLHSQGLSSEEIAAFLQESHAFDDAGQLAACIARLLSGREPPGRLAREFSGEPAQQFVLLQHALQQGRSAEADEQTLAEIQEACASLAMEHGAAIQAGLNTCRAAGAHASDRAGVERFQGVYRDVVLGDASLAGVLKTLLERLDNPDGPAFSRGLRALIRALGDDLGAQRPSADACRLQALVSDLYHLQVTSTVLDHCNQLCATLAGRSAT